VTETTEAMLARVRASFDRQEMMSTLGVNVDHDDRSAAGRTGTGLTLRYDALDPGFQGASPAGRIGVGCPPGRGG
jgi:hypothetical protein